mgnify:CR=1 FL=1
MLFTENQFTNSYDVPEGGASPDHAHDQVTLSMSDNTVALVFDKLSTGLKLLAFMRTNSQWNVYGGDDIVCVSVGAAKMLVLETTLINQKLITSYLPIYLGGEVRWANRTTSLVLSTTDALKSAGFCHIGGLPFNNNLDLRTGSANMQLVDWNYMSNPANSSEGSLLSDPNPLRFDFT